MGYEYDSQVNRELAKTAMDIYKKAHKIDQPINESPQNLNEEVIRENVNGLIMNYISDVIILAEAQMGREMTDIEISEASDELLRRIDSISDTDKVAFINELSEAMAPTMTASPTVTTGGGAAAAPSRPTAGGPSVGGRPSRPGVVAGRPPADVGGRPGAIGVRGNQNVEMEGLPPFVAADYLPGGRFFGAQGGAAGQNAAVTALFDTYGSQAGGLLTQLLANPNYVS